MGKLVRPDGTKISDVVDITVEGDWVDLGIAGDVFAVNSAAEMILVDDDGRQSRILSETCLTYGYAESADGASARLRARVVPVEPS